MPVISGGPISNISENRGNTRRTTSFLHRSAITNVDKLAAPGTITTADVATGGSLNFATTYKVAAASGNRYGNTLASPIASQVTASDASATHIIDVTFTAVANAEWYDIFLSTDAAPKWVGRITAAQLAAGGFRITAVGTYASGGLAAAGHLYVEVVGTGVATGITPFAVNSAWTPQLITPINCAGYSRIRILSKLLVTDLRSDPGTSGSVLKLAVFVQNDLDSDFYLVASLSTVSFGGSASAFPMYQDTLFTIDGGAAVVICVCDNALTSSAALPGTGTSVSIYTELT